MTEIEEIAVREYIALNHEDGKCRIYGDDGELQCNNFKRHGRCIDFKRDSITDILKTLRETAFKEYALLQR